MRQEINFKTVGFPGLNVGLDARPMGDSTHQVLVDVGFTHRSGIISTQGIYQVIAVLAHSLEQEDPGAFERWCDERSAA